MGFTFKWDDESETRMRYTAEGRWNWNEYHKCVRMSLFSFTRAGQNVDSIIDLRGSESLPAGAVGHVRSMAKVISPAQSGRAVVIGLDTETITNVGAVDRIFRNGKQVIQFVDSDEEAYAVLRGWQVADKENPG